MNIAYLKEGSFRVSRPIVLSEEIKMTIRLPAFLLLLVLSVGAVRAADQVLLEAENFDDIGGWVVDQQFMDQMGSPYLLAHGLGDPVRDAVTMAKFPSAGKYRLWVRTRDWVAPWKMPGAPGKFQVLIDDKPLPATFGIEGAAWHWQDGGLVDVRATTKVALHDLMGFEGRCDAL
ncbi:MAG: NADH-dependent oxidoreductase, partial [Thermoguttaceae bacterium]